jgi:hypothetical protein
LHDVTEFGYLALGLAVPTRSDDGTGVLESAPREYRVSDVFAFQPGNHKTGVKATFVRKPDTPVLRVHSYVP